MDSSSFASFVFSLWDRPKTSADPGSSEGASHKGLRIYVKYAHLSLWPNALRFGTQRSTQTYIRKECAECSVSSQSGIPHLSGTFHPLVGQKRGAASWPRYNILAGSSQSSFLFQQWMCLQPWAALLIAADSGQTLDRQTGPSVSTDTEVYCWRSMTLSPAAHQSAVPCGPFNWDIAI